MSPVEKLISVFDLQRHPEGGWFRESYRSDETIGVHALPERFGGDRSFSTAIYFLLGKDNYSAFHRIRSDECWHFYAGDPLNVYVLLPDGALKTITLGNAIEKGHLFQYVVPANCWFASRPAEGSEYCFVGCTVSPGFDFKDFELAVESDLVNEYPVHRDLIVGLCR